MRIEKRQSLVLVVSILASLVAFLDGAIVNVALPAIQRDLGGGLAAQQWVVDAYLLTLGSLILIAGSLSDLFGRKKVMAWGLICFGAASLLCALAPDSSALIVFRALQGVAGALLVPSSLAMIISTYDGAAQGKAIGTWTAWTGIAFIIGPLLGGALVDVGSWRWIFAVNVVPIAVTLYLLRHIKTDHPQKNVKVDVGGALLCALGLGGPVFALIEQPHYGWGSPFIFGPLALGVILFVLFLWRERRAKAPMLPLSLFRNHNFSVGNVATLSIYAGLSVATFLIILFVQQVGGYSALLAGLSLLPVTLIMFFLSPQFGKLSASHGPRLYMGVGPLIAAVGFLMISRMPADFDYWTQLLPGIIIFGLGLATTVAPLTAAILGDVPKSQAGIASAVNNAVARVAGLVAIAAVGAIIAFQFGRVIDRNVSCLDAPASAINKAKQNSLVTRPPAPYQHDAAFKGVLTSASVQAFQTGMVSIAVLLAAGGVVSLVGIRNPKRS